MDKLIGYGLDVLMGTIEVFGAILGIIILVALFPISIPVLLFKTYQHYKG